MRAAALLGVLALCSCQASHPRDAGPPTVVIHETIDPAAVAQPEAEHATGHLLIRVLTVHCGITSIVGTHAEFTPDRPLCDVRIRVRSNDSTFHTFDTARQRLVVGSAALPPAADVMRIKRQPDQQQLGAHDVVELNLWFMPPVGAVPSALTLVGDHDADPGGSSVSPAAAPMVTVPLRGMASS